MAKSIISLVLALFVMSAYADEDVKPIVIASSDVQESPVLPSMGDEPAAEETAKPSIVGKAIIAIGVAAAAYYVIKENSDKQIQSVSTP